MNVKIISDFGENNFVMNDKNVKDIIKHAMQLDERKNEKECVQEAPIEACNDSIQEPVKENEKEEKAVHWANRPLRITSKKSRTESLFGEDWRSNIHNPAEKQENKKDDSKGYRGFLYIKCPNCGTVKGFYTRNELKAYECSCGEKTELKDLKPMYVNCECGKDYRYFTNMDSSSFRYKCFNCGRFTDLYLNSRSTAYVTWKKADSHKKRFERDKYGRSYY